MTPTETRILALALSAIDDLDARVVCDDAILEGSGNFEEIFRRMTWMQGVDWPELWLRRYAAIAAVFLFAEWCNTDSIEDHLDRGWFPYSVRWRKP